MYGILGEHKSDVATLKVIIRRLAGNDKLSIHGKGYGGCGELLRKGAREIQGLIDAYDCSRFIVCRDADGPTPDDSRSKVLNQIVRPSGVDEDCCVVVPVQELEAWILADLPAVSNVITGWRPPDITKQPESIESPKEYLEHLSRSSNKRPRYSHATHNEKVAMYLDLNKIQRMCPSFRPLVAFVLNS